MLGGRGLAYSITQQWVPISSPLTHIVYLLPLFRSGYDDSYRFRNYCFVERQKWHPVFSISKDDCDTIAKLLACVVSWRAATLSTRPVFVAILHPIRLLSRSHNTDYLKLRVQISPGAQVGQPSRLSETGSYPPVEDGEDKAAAMRR